MLRSYLFMALVCLMPLLALADMIDQQNVGAMPPPMGDDNWNVSGVFYTRWEGQSITPTLPIMTGFDFAVLANNHPWNSLPPGTVFEGRVYGNSGGLPSVLLATVSKAIPIAPNSLPWQTFTYRFDLPTPLNIGALGYLGPAGISIVLAMNQAGTGAEHETLFSPPTYYSGGLALVSYDQGGTWYMDSAKDMMFHTYGDIPEPATISLLGLSALALLRKRHN